jgi:hypothetical protein
MSEKTKGRAMCGRQYEAYCGGRGKRATQTTPAVRARSAAIRCAVLVVLALAGMAVLSGCTSGGGTAANDSALAAKVQTAINAAGNGTYVESVSAESDGKVTVTLNGASSPTSTSWIESAVAPMIAFEVLDKVPEVKELTVAWDAAHPIGVWKQK